MPGRVCHESYHHAIIRKIIPAFIHTRRFIVVLMGLVNFIKLILSKDGLMVAVFSGALPSGLEGSRNYKSLSENVWSWLDENGPYLLHG